MEREIFKKNIQRLEQLLTGRNPRDLEQGYLSVITSDLRMLEGTTVPVIEPHLVRTKAGLLVPATYRQETSPFDIFAVYLTFERLSGQRISLPSLVAQLQTFPLDSILEFVAFWLGKFYVPGGTHQNLDSQYLDQFTGDTRAKIENLAKYEELRLITPQALLVLAKLAFFSCSKSGSLSQQEINARLPVLPFLVADQLSASDGMDNAESVEAADLTPEIASNQYFNVPRDPAQYIARWVRQWRQLPIEDDSEYRMEKWDDLYSEATGTTYEDLARIALALWSSVNAGHSSVPLGYFTNLGISQSQVDSVMRLIGATPTRMLEELREHYEKTNLAGLRWDFSAFSRFPVLCLEEGYRVVNPNFLLQRAFGWALFFDVASHLKAVKDPRKDAFMRAARHYGECYVVEILRSIVNLSGEGSLYTEKELQLAYPGAGIQVVDAVIAFENSWIVLEVSSRQLMRETVAGLSNESLEKDIEMLAVEKGKQIASTICQLRTNEEGLTGLDRMGGRKFLPVIVATEGFPINQLTYNRIRERLEGAELLQETDVLPLQIMDVSELEMVEGLVEAGGLNFANLLLAKRDGLFSEASVRDYIVRGDFPEVVRPKRIDALWPKPFNEVIAMVEGETINRLDGNSELSM